jgi:hypothetical protein
MTGMLTDEYGIPIYEQTLDGNTSDSTWIKSAIHYLQGLLGDESGDYTFIADSKLDGQFVFDWYYILGIICSCYGGKRSKTTIH